MLLLHIVSFTSQWSMVYKVIDYTTYFYSYRYSYYIFNIYIYVWYIVFCSQPSLQNDDSTIDHISSSLYSILHSFSFSSINRIDLMQINSAFHLALILFSMISLFKIHFICPTLRNSGNLPPFNSQHNFIRIQRRRL